MSGKVRINPFHPQSGVADGPDHPLEFEIQNLREGRVENFRRGMYNCRFTIDVRLEGYTKATESRRILVATNFYKRRPDRHVYHTTSEALFAT